MLILLDGAHVVEGSNIAMIILEGNNDDTNDAIMAMKL